MLKEFKEFATRGNVIDMAIGVIVGGAFQKIVTSLVNDIIMPTVAIFTGKVTFDDLTLTVGNSVIKYGSFITTIVDFLIIAFSIFIAIRTFTKLNNKTKENLQKLTKKENESDREIITEPTTKLCPYCYSEIDIKATKCAHCTSSLLEEEKATT